MTTWMLFIVWVTFNGTDFGYSATRIAEGFDTQQNCYYAGLNITAQLTWQIENAKRNVTFICAENKPQ